MKWFYILSETGPDHRLYTVGYEDQNGDWHTDSDHNDKEEAAKRVHYLNGGSNNSAPIAVNMLKMFEAIEMAIGGFLALKAVGYSISDEIIEHLQGVIREVSTKQEVQ